MAFSAAMKATTVLPEPTSPWTRRFIGCGAAMSFFISSRARSCAPVSLKGRSLLNPPSRTPSKENPMPRSFLTALFLSNMPSSSRNSSSNTRPFFAAAGVRTSEPEGICASMKAVLISGRACLLKTSPGTPGKANPA